MTKVEMLKKGFEGKVGGKMKKAILEYTCPECGELNRTEYINTDGETPVISLDELEAIGDLSCKNCNKEINVTIGVL